MPTPAMPSMEATMNKPVSLNTVAVGVAHV